MKLTRNPSIAFILSFFVPGLGLWYCAEWIKGIVNLGLALLTGLAVSVIGLSLPAMAILCGISSGAWAYIIAQEQNMTQDSQHTGGTLRR